MVLAVTYDNGEIGQHFGHSEYFKFYDIDGGKILDSEVVSTEGQGHCALAQFLYDNGTDALICGGIGPGAQMALGEAGIVVFAGVMGNADQVVNDFIKGELQYQSGATCDHHSHGDGGCGHNCGDHECHH